MLQPEIFNKSITTHVARQTFVQLFIPFYLQISSLHNIIFYRTVLLIKKKITYLLWILRVILRSHPGGSRAVTEGPLTSCYVISCPSVCLSSWGELGGSGYLYAMDLRLPLLYCYVTVHVTFRYGKCYKCNITHNLFSIFNLFHNKKF